MEHTLLKETFSQFSIVGLKLCDQTNPDEGTRPPFSESKTSILVVIVSPKVCSAVCKSHTTMLTHSRRALLRVFDIGFVQIEDILGIILVQEFFKKSN